MPTSTQKWLPLTIGLVLLVVLAIFFFKPSQYAPFQAYQYFKEVKDCVEQTQELTDGDNIVVSDFDCAIKASVNLYPNNPELAIELCKEFSPLPDSSSPFPEIFCKDKIERSFIAPTLDEKPSYSGYEDTKHGYQLDFPTTWHSVAQGSPDPTLLSHVEFARTGDTDTKGFDYVSISIFSEQGDTYNELANMVDSVVKKQDNKFYVFSYRADNDSEATKQVFNNMVSSFKFQ